MGQGQGLNDNGGPSRHPKGGFRALGWWNMALAEGFLVFQQTVPAIWTYPASDPIWKRPLRWERIIISVLPLPTTNRC